MTKRLQVLFDDAEYAALQAAAASRGMTTAEWVRQALLAARRAAATGEVDRKLAVIRAAVRHAAPSGPIERLLAEGARGYSVGLVPGSEAGPGESGY